MIRPTTDIDAFSPEVYADEAGIAAKFAAMRAQGDILWIEQEPYRPFWAVLRHQTSWRWSATPRSGSMPRA